MKTKEIKNISSQLSISLPIAFESLINILMTLVDTLVISLVGINELNALGAMSVIISIMQMSIQTINVSNNTLVAISLGEKTYEKLKLIAGNSIILTIIISIITIIIITLIKPIFPTLFNVDKIAITYITIRLFGFIQNSLVTVLSGYQRTLGRQKNILNLRIFAVILNLILDLIAVKYGYGIIGVALATIIIDTILFIYLTITSKNNIKIRYKKIYFKEILKLFKWNYLERIISKIDNLIFNLIVSRIGPIEYSVHVILLQITNIYESFNQGFGDGITISVGIALGKKDKKYQELVKKISKKLINYCSIIIPIIIFIISIIIMKISLREPYLQNIFYKTIPIFIFSTYIITSATYYFAILRGNKEFKFLANRNLISSIIKIIISIILSFTNLKVVGVWLGYLAYGISQKYLSIKKYKLLNYQNKI